MGVGSGQFADILKGDEVELFLKEFILPDKIRAAAEHDHPDTKFPKDTNDVLKDVKEIWEKKGFLSPAELRDELTKKYTPGADPKLRKFMSDVELSRNIPEKTTGYLSKEHAYLTTALAHLFGKETDKPIAMVEVDFSNMGGTNDEFKRRLAAKLGIPIDEVNTRLAEGMTDKAVRLLCDVMTKTLGDSIPKGAKIVPIRTGGDEVRLIFTGIDDPAELNRITAKLHAAIEANVAGMGIQDHAHLKAPDNHVRDGFGSAVAIKDMRKIDNPATIIQELDEHIKGSKEDIGHNRLGTINEARERQRIEAGIESGALKIPEGQTHAEFVQAQIDEAARISRRTSEQLRQANPIHAQPGIDPIAAFEAHVERVTPLMGDTPIVSAPLPAAIANSNPIGEERPANVAPLADMSERRASVAANYLAEQHVSLSPVEQYFLNQSIQNLTSIDPSAKARMPQEIIDLTTIHAREGDEFRSKLDPNDPKVQEGLKRSGLTSVAEVKPTLMAVSFHNLAGLNNELGHNNADLYLRHFSTIMDDAFKKAGYEGNGKKPYTIAHHGGANFTVMVNPAAVDAQGNMTFMSDAKLKEIERHIASGVDTLNKKNVAEFLQERGVRVTDEMRAELDKKGITTTGTIPDPKERAHSSDEKIKARVDGIHSVVTSGEVHTADAGPVQTQELVHKIRSQADVGMGQLRDDKVMAQHQANIITAAPTPTISPATPPTGAPTTTPPSADAGEHAPSKTSGGGGGGKLESHTKVTGSGIGIGMGIYGLTQKFGEDGTATKDLNNKDTRAMAQAGIAADAGAIAADVAELATLQKASAGLKVASKVSRVAAPVAVALSVASGAIDYKIAAKTKDAARASDAIGGTAGGMAGAAVGGAVGAKTGAAIGAAIGVWFGGIGAAPGAIIGGFVGGLVGAVGGAMAGAEAGKKVADVTIKDSLQKKYDEERKVETAAFATQLKSQNKNDLVKTIQQDNNLPHKLNLRGQEVTLAQAMDDKIFRATMIKNMEAEAKKNPALEKSVIALKEYGSRLDTEDAAKAKATAAKSEPVKSAATIVADAQYKSMSVTQLASVIQKDQTLPDTVKIGNKEVLLCDALKDKKFRDNLIDNLEKAEAKGSDLHAQIAMVKAYESALAAQAKAPSSSAPAAQVAQQTPKTGTPAMG